MPDPADETGYTDAPKLPDRTRAEREASEFPADDDDIAQRIIRTTPFPVLMLTTGILWILAGAAYLALFGFLRLIGTPMQGNDIWLIIGAAFFIKDGIQLIRGKFRDPQLDGIISVLIGVFFYGEATYRFTESAGIFALAFGLFFGSIFLVPGVLVLIGRSQYLVWLAEQDELANAEMDLRG